MGTAIRHGARVRAATPAAAATLFEALRPEAERLVAAETAAALARRACERLDAAAMRGEAAGDPFAAIASAYARAASGVPASESSLDLDLDFGFRVALLPGGGTVLAAVLAGRRAYADLVLAQAFAEPFSWDDGERPRAIPAKVWAERASAWRAALARCPGGRLPGRDGLMLEYRDPGPPPGPDLLRARVPARSERVSRAARDAVLDARTRATGNTIRAAVAALDWLDGSEGREALAAARALAEARLPRIATAP